MKRIPLCGRNGVGKFALVNNADYRRFTEFRWYFKCGYAFRVIKGEVKNRIVYLHRAILDATSGIEVDHINRDGLDCRRKNLRHATRLQNILNAGPRKNGASKFKGVEANRKKWRARIRLDGVRVNLGTFDTEEQAALVYNKHAKKLFGEFAYINQVEVS